MEQHKTIKFDINTDYNLILSFDEPKVFPNQKFGGNSNMYGGKASNDFTYMDKDLGKVSVRSGEEIRFYASPGLHEEIKKQNLKQGNECNITKVKPGDFAYFKVNGQSKHELMTVGEFKANEVEAKPEPTFQNAPGHNDSDLVEKVNVLWKWMEGCKVDKDGEKIPF